MSHLPRNSVIAKKNLNRNTRSAISSLKKDTSILNNLCDKYNIKDLTFRSSKFISDNGTITSINHNSVKGNLRSGILLINCSNLSIIPNEIYDIITIKKNKLMLDQKKNIEAQNKAKPELERINQQIKKRIENESVTQDNIDILATQHNEDEIITQDNETEIITQDNEDEIITQDNEDDMVTQDNEDDMVIQDNDDIVTQDNDDIVAQNNGTIVHNDQPNKPKRIAKTIGNKFFRNFMKDIKEKFKLEFKDNYEFCELRKDATDMVIENVNVYKINISTKEMYFLIIGELQMKRGLIKQIDPTYETDRVIDDHNSFMEKINKTHDNVQHNMTS